MYGQGSYNSQFGQGSHTPMPPPYPQRLPGPPPLAPHFQRGPPGPPPSVIQPGLPIYQHGPPGAMPNTSQSYSHPQPTVHGSTPFTQPPSHLGSQNVHHMPRSLPPPPPSRVLPPPPPLPAAMYRGPVLQQSQQLVGVQGLQHIPPPPPPPPPTSSFIPSSSFGGFVHSNSGNSHMPSMAAVSKPPPPSSPPPVPPSPPPPTSPLLSSMNHQAASNLTSSNEASTSNVIRSNLPLDDGYSNQEQIQLGDGFSSRGSVMLDLPPPPPKPRDERVVQKIEELCHLIADKGPCYEDSVRQNESGNPEFQFLFAGDLGSEGAISHEYFLWMKKYNLAFHLDGVKSDSPLRPLGINSLMQPDPSVIAAGSHSPADSDMEMEDDITRSDYDQGVNPSTEGTNSGYVLVHNELDVKEQLHTHISSGWYPADNISSENISFSVAPVVVGYGCSPVLNSDDEWSFVSNLKKPVTLLADHKNSSTASAVGEHDNFGKNSRLLKGGSPFRLLQDYASDESSEDDDDVHLEYATPSKDSSSIAVRAISLHRDTECNLKTEAAKGLNETGLSVSLEAGNVPRDSGTEVKETATTSIVSATTDDDVNDKNIASISHATSPQAIPKKDALGGACFEASLKGKFEKENEEKGMKSASDSLKVDKFGRLVREGASDSDSDDLRHNGRQSKRGRSRSRSPLNRRRRRSPWKRREKRSRSRSWSPRKRRSRSRSPRSRRSGSRSPRKRRSRSRSPAFRHVGEFSGENIRRDRGQIPDCFDFRRGKCYRGASCRYLHHESDKSDGSRRHRSKNQFSEVQPISKNSDIHEETMNSLQNASDMPGSSSGAKEDGNINQKRENSVSNALQCASLNQESRLVDSHKISSDSSREVVARVLDYQVLQEEIKVPTTITTECCQEAMECHHPKLVDGVITYPISAADALKLHGHASQDILSQNNSAFKHSQSNVSDAMLHNADRPTQLTDNSSVSDISPQRTSMTSVTKLPVTEALPTTTQFKHHSSLLPPPPPTLTQGVAAQHMTQPPGNYGLIPQTASLPIHSASGERFPSYMLPNQQSHFSMSPIPSWTSLPPPPPGVSSQLQQSRMPPGNDFGSQTISRPLTAEFQNHSQVSDLQQQAYPPMHGEDLRFRPPPSYNSPSQQFVGPSLLREDHLAQRSMLGLNAPRSFAQGDNQPLPTPFLRELSANKMQQFSGDSLPPGELSKSSSQIHPYPQQQQPPYGLHHPETISSSSRYPPDLQETNQASHLPDFRGSRNLTHYNPYASTFEQPLGSNFRSDDFRQEKDAAHCSNYAAPFNLSHTQVDGQDIGSARSRQATSSPNSARAVGQNFPMSGGDQYDPLFDSIEPSSKLSKKFNNFQKWEPSSDSDMMLRNSGSNKPLDVEENNKKKEVGGVVLETSVDNEECGETADAEVGAVENESPSNPIDDSTSLPPGEIEIDQIKSPGKSKKSKESRSMKLFKVALAEFVKEVLKPSWRQGNMSKEAFKTIVKKTVDKVSGAMKSHQIPKSRAKIDQYIDSSQRKLTKLVTGYVDKYVKM
ncbi:hypothetical protein EZV62_024144 [Acer yangbiense]|uniref:C3H1-type domain-containing protein n=1 Tax=Acer yangbiense TaxID=1000413 RepID=A0A5C7H3P8_9ROSI|nr:hypothetical protein EZV62_024144 [Acer yangbiense]